MIGLKKNEKEPAPVAGKFPPPKWEGIEYEKRGRPKKKKEPFWGEGKAHNAENQTLKRCIADNTSIQNWKETLITSSNQIKRLWTQQGGIMCNMNQKEEKMLGCAFPHLPEEDGRWQSQVRPNGLQSKRVRAMMWDLEERNVWNKKRGTPKSFLMSSFWKRVFGETKKAHYEKNINGGGKREREQEKQEKTHVSQKEKKRP